MKLTSIKEFMNEHYRVDEKSQEELIKYYEKNLEKVKTVYRDDDLKKEYISFAQGQLDAVKSGGMKELQKFWKNNKVNEADNKKTLLSFWNSSAEVLKLLDDEDNKKMKDCLKDIDKIISKIK